MLRRARKTPPENRNPIEVPTMKKKNPSEALILHPVAWRVLAWSSGVFALAAIVFLAIADGRRQGEEAAGAERVARAQEKAEARSAAREKERVETFLREAKAARDEGEVRTLRKLR